MAQMKQTVASIVTISGPYSVTNQKGETRKVQDVKLNAGQAPFDASLYFRANGKPLNDNDVGKEMIFMLADGNNGPYGWVSSYSTEPRPQHQLSGGRQQSRPESDRNGSIERQNALRHADQWLPFIYAADKEHKEALEGYQDVANMCLHFIQTSNWGDWWQHNEGGNLNKEDVQRKYQGATENPADDIPF